MMAHAKHRKYVLTYDGRPSYIVSIMEFLDGKRTRTTRISAIRSSRGLRAPWLERMP